MSFASRALSAGLILGALASCGSPPSGHTPIVPAGQTVAVAVDPAATEVPGGRTARFSATVTGSANTAVAWDVVEAAGGAIDTTGLYTAPASAGVFHVRATSAAAPQVSAEATVTVTPPVAVTVSPQSTSVLAGGTVAFSATVTNASNTSVAWSVAPAGCGTITPAGVYTAPSTARTCTVVATSQADPLTSASATVTVTAAPPSVVVTVSPPSASLVAGSTFTFTASVTNASNTSVSWSVAPAGCGTITSAGAYTAPATAGTCTVVATSQADPSKSASATVTITAPPAPVVVTVTPSPAAVDACTARTFSAAVTGTSNTAVTWSVQEGAAGGSITTAGVYTAPSSAGTYHVVATSKADPTKSAIVTVTVSDRILSVAVNPPTIQVAPGGSSQFTATVTTTCGASTATSSVAVTAAGEVVVQ